MNLYSGASPGQYPESGCIWRNKAKQKRTDNNNKKTPKKQTNKNHTHTHTHTQSTRLVCRIIHQTKMRIDVSYFPDNSRFCRVVFCIVRCAHHLVSSFYPSAHGIDLFSRVIIYYLWDVTREGALCTSCTRVCVPVQTTLQVGHALSQQTFVYQVKKIWIGAF